MILNLKNQKITLIYFIAIFLFCTEIDAQNSKDITKNKSQNTMSLFGGLGVAPLNSNLGIGYFITQKIVGYTRIAILITPNFFNYSTNIGARFAKNSGSSIVYSLELGILFDGQYRTYNGIVSKGGMGYMFLFNSSFFSCNMNLYFLAPNDRTRKIVPELEIIIGLFI